jgi:hypothetical protein
MTQEDQGLTPSRVSDDGRVKSKLSGEWLPVEAADFDLLFSRSEWVLAATSSGRVTIAKPIYVDQIKLWVAGTGANLSDPRWPSEFLPERILHWMPLPSPPPDPPAASDKSREGQ